MANRPTASVINPNYSPNWSIDSCGNVKSANRAKNASRQRTSYSCVRCVTKRCICIVWDPSCSKCLKQPGTVTNASNASPVRRSSNLLHKGRKVNGSGKIDYAISVGSSRTIHCKMMRTTSAWSVWSSMRANSLSAISASSGIVHRAPNSHPSS